MSRCSFPDQAIRMNHMIKSLLLGALIVVANDDARAASVQPISKVLPQMCKTLQQQGWVAPEDMLHPGHRQQAEMNVPGIMYMCSLEQRLAGVGPGHKPDLQVLLGDSGNDPSIIFSADVWCAGDRAAALTALADQLTRQITAVGWTIPPKPWPPFAPALPARQQPLRWYSAPSRSRLTRRPVKKSATMNLVPC